ncbi:MULTISPECIES: murein L,D-transpeptidase catalytic domain family protein [Legionella]|uniref:Murein L,D-transpeptidase catalytic domain family protein n=1 Tax=Legionella septentrionalis TaxID=2498109 RepID=A0A3S0X5A3_9GAMM|nr:MULTISPECIES: murein L,D-transpeptidase catalytic domain family protein [Legionella]MCP0913436.1 murein L,D-transpeptidase catalytic domain family protein [Legionella sp. 27cVA30]RUQ89786.1 murein L,D-transpeptidase catalytic domain family protein [Legionella septentrionalis]RUQ99574.1 murein L,D-transpeptidase catalytic domain family protein [Legionella septentrionalis]RUR09829.1 murein L,D-transpeptidase catalytic domain family protein [Legionella septentrionalis]RUR13626.1 murein L,D-tra
MNTILTLISVAMLTSNMTSSAPLFAKPALHQPKARQHLQPKALDINAEVNQLSRKAPTLNKKVLKLALAAYQKAKQKGAVKKPVLTVIDYSLPSSKQRMWVFDVSKERLLYNTYVAHGKNSGLDIPHHFSNKPSSKATSLGTFVTRNTYIGSKGYSLNLQGLEKGFNDNAFNRRVVIHGAWYVEPSFIKKAGRAGRSWGCPSIAQTLAKPVINTIKGGSVVFAYYPDRNYLSRSGFAVA